MILIVPFYNLIGSAPVHKKMYIEKDPNTKKGIEAVFLFSFKYKIIFIKMLDLLVMEKKINFRSNKKKLDYINQNFY